MPVLGFVPAAAPEISYAAFKAAVDTGGVFGAELAAAEATAVAGLTLAGAAIVGAGLSGIAIGQAILRGLQPTLPDLPVRQLYKAPGGQGTVIVTYSFKTTNNPAVTAETEIIAPFVGVLATTPPNEVRTEFFILDANNNKVDLLLAAPSAIDITPYIVSARLKSNNQPAEALKIPTLPPASLPTPFKKPTAIPIAPNIPDFPITPEIVPYEAPTIEKPTEEKAPGVIVQIPETGRQVVFTPTGVRISNYLNPGKGTLAEPQPPLPPTPKKVATEPCPCPDHTAEILCRLKALETGLLNDGYDYTTHVGAGGDSGVQIISTDEPFSVTIDTVSAPLTARNESGGTASPQVTFTGWFSAIINGRPSVRIPIHYAHQTFLLDRNAQGYSFCGYTGFVLSSTYVTRKSRAYVDLC